MRKALVLALVLASAAAVWAAADGPRKMGTVKIVTPGLVVNLKGEPAKPGRKSNDVPIPPLKEVPLPEGTYDVGSLQLFTQAVRKGKPEVWSLESAEELGKLKSFSVAAGGTTTLEGGPPLALKIKAAVQEVDANDRPVRQTWDNPTHPAVRVLFTFVGKAGEEYQPRPKRGKNAGPSPQVRLLDGDGKVLDQGTYRSPMGEVGSAADTYAVGAVPEGYCWRIPKDFKGRVRVEVVPEIGSLECKPPDPPVTVEIAGK